MRIRARWLLSLVTGLTALSLLVPSVACGPKGGLPSAGGSGTLTLSGEDPLTLDPATSGDAASNGYIIQIFSGLVKLGADLEPAGDIASDWQISPDGLTYTFNLRHDVTFQDGRKLTAADIKYSWERACLPATASQTASTYLGDILGVPDMLAGKAQSLSGVQIAGDYTLKVTLVNPSSAFLSKLSYTTAMVVDKNDVAKGSSWWSKPNGSGAFRLVSWTPGSELVLERNPGYYGDKAKLNKVDYKLLAGLPMDLYESGQMDVADVSIDHYDRVTDPAGSFYSQLVTSPELSLTYLGFDVTKPPFDDPAIRRAFAMAVDKDRLARIMFRDVLSPAAGVLPPGIPGYNPALNGIPFDVAGARDLIAASSYGSAANLPPITITVSGYGASAPGDLVAIVYDWEQAFGIDISIRQLDPSVFSYYLKQEKDNLYYWSWGADYASPQDFLEVLFGEGMAYNIGEYSNADFNSLLAQAAAATDQSKSLSLYQQAEQILVSDAACIPLWTGQSMQLVQSYVKGYKLNALGQAALNEVYVQR